MFTPVVKRPKSNLGHTMPGSPATPLADNRRSSPDHSVPNRPSTGTPALWAPRLSVFARMPIGNKSGKGDETDPIKPVYVGEFPQVVRDEQTRLLQKRSYGDAYICGGMEKETSLAWIICGNRLFIWNFQSPSMNCVTLEIPSNILENSDTGKSNSWLLCVINWGNTSRRTDGVVKHHNSSGIVLCNKKTRAVIYWPDIFSDTKTGPVSTFASTDESQLTSSPVVTPSIQKRLSGRGSGLMGLSSFNSLIASAIPDSQHACVVLATSSNGELWLFHCSTSNINSQKIEKDVLSLSSQSGESGQTSWSKGYPRSLIWQFSHPSTQESKRQFFLLTDHEIQCFNLDLYPIIKVSKFWSHEIIGTNGDLGIKKDLAGQKRIWPLDVQLDNHGKVITILIATLCKDRVSSSNYTQYSLLTLQYKSGYKSGANLEHLNDSVLEKKAPIQVIIPKARVENEDFLFSMRLRVGGKPAGSTVILSGDGTATVSHYFKNSTRLYQFDLPYDAGKVLDASILSSVDDGEEGAWIILTEKAGIWAIPEKAVIFGAVEPPERSLSRKGSTNEGSPQEEKKSLTFGSSMALRRASFEAMDTGDRKIGDVPVIPRRNIQDEESEPLLSQLFHQFQLSGQVDASFEKLQKFGAFDRDGETNVFARMSKSIVDTLAKHWTTTRGAEILAMAVISSQLLEKQQKHEKFLQFLALSKCHDELCSRQRHALQIILEHGEKLYGIIQLRELQNAISQNSSTGFHHSISERQMPGALWDLIQLVGERARRSTVLLMDRDNAEVFYSKVSNLEEVFYCLDKHLEYITSTEQQLEIQIQRACELSNACVTIVQAALHYKNEHHLWYPPPEGLTPWYCQHVVRNGMWCVASFMLQLLKEVSKFDMSLKSDLYNHLESLAEVLLEAYTGAVTAKIESGKEHKGLLDEYWKRRDVLLDTLYKQVKEFVEARHQDLNGKQNEDILRNLSANLLDIAKRHACYSTMWEMSYDLNDSTLLRNLMHESMGPDGGFCHFVFQQLYASRQFSKILRLGEEFTDELSIFLKHHQDLLWLHELYLNQFAPASETLHMLALSQEESLMTEEEEGTAITLKLLDRKRLLYLSKIAAVAGGDAEIKVERIEADLKILKLQEEIMKLLADNGSTLNGKQLLHPEKLIKLCLGVEGINPELSLWAFEVFSWTSSSFRKMHKNLLEDCWKNAADQDDWNNLYQASVTEGWTDEKTLQILRQTMLFKVSNRCYGSQAETFGEGFEEVLPLSQEHLETHSLKDSGSSVEAILMRHRDFPEAGKLMRTALMLGAQDDNIEELGPSLME